MFQNNVEKLTKVETYILIQLMHGSSLKSHRYLDGRKEYKLHPLNGSPETVTWDTVSSLKDKGMIDSNKKFPAATYLLTEPGRQLAETLTSSGLSPLSAKTL